MFLNLDFDSFHIINHELEYEDKTIAWNTFGMTCVRRTQTREWSTTTYNCIQTYWQRWKRKKKERKEKENTNHGNAHTLTKFCIENSLKYWQISAFINLVSLKFLVKDGVWIEISTSHLDMTIAST